MGEVALWYRRYRVTDYSIWDSEEEAAGIAAAMEDDGAGVVKGVQFQDGRLIPAEEWEAFARARERRERAWEEREAKQEPRPKRKITAPFGGGIIEIDAREPSWLGEQPLHAGRRLVLSLVLGGRCGIRHQVDRDSGDHARHQRPPVEMPCANGLS